MTDLSVSVVIPTYNRAQYIVRAVDSALSQVRPGDEIIVVDDGSTDETEAVLESVQDRIRYIKTTNAGAGAARNVGIAAAQAQLVAFLDSDDEWMEHKLEIQRRFLQANPKVLFCFSDFAVTSERDGSVTRNFLEKWHKDPRSWDDILGAGKAYTSYAQLPQGMRDFEVYIGDLSTAEILSSYVLTSSMMVRKEDAGDALQFAEDVATWEDFECFGRLSLRGVCAYLDIETSWQHGAAEGRLSGVNDYRRAYANVRILERVWGENEQFLSEHREIYQQAIGDGYRWLLRELVASGRTSEARQVLKKSTGMPLLLRVLAFVPPGITRSLISMKHRLLPG